MKRLLTEMWRIKQTLDPNLILGNGNIFNTKANYFDRASLILARRVVFVNGLDM